MSEPNWFAMHYLRAWEERAGNPTLPKWFRVVSLAFGKQRSNGHAPFAAGDMAFILGGVDPDTGEYFTDPNVSHHIALAVDYGLLHRESCSRCLVVLASTVEGGIGGKGMASAPCPWHHRNAKLNKSVAVQRKRAEICN